MATKTSTVIDLMRRVAGDGDPLDAEVQRQLHRWATTASDTSVIVAFAGRHDLPEDLAAALAADRTPEVRVAWPRDEVYLRWSPPLGHRAIRLGGVRPGRRARPRRPHRRGDPPLLTALEAVAATLDRGEDPAESVAAAVRELAALEATWAPAHEVFWDSPAS